MSYCKRKRLTLAIKAAIGLHANCEPVMKSLDDMIFEAFYAAKVFSDEGVIVGRAGNEIVAKNILACSDAFSD